MNKSKNIFLKFRKGHDKRLTESAIREAVKKMKVSAMQQDIYLEIKNVDLFEALRKAGKIQEIRPGVWDLVKKKGD